MTKSFLSYFYYLNFILSELLFWLIIFVNCLSYYTIYSLPLEFSFARLFGDFKRESSFCLLADFQQVFNTSLFELMIQNGVSESQSYVISEIHPVYFLDPFWCDGWLCLLSPHRPTYEPQPINHSPRW